MNIEQAYELMRNPTKLSLHQRLECHQLMLRHFQPIDKSRHMAEAIADVCEAVSTLVPKR